MEETAKCVPWKSNLCGKRFFPLIPLPLFSSLAYIFHGEIYLSSLTCLGGAAVQISLKREECCVAVAISWGMTQYWSGNLLPHKLDPHGRLLAQEHSKSTSCTSQNENYPFGEMCNYGVGGKRENQPENAYQDCSHERIQTDPSPIKKGGSVVR